MTDKKVRIVLFGDGGVGKSALTIRYFQGIFVDGYDPTIEDSYTKWVSTKNGDRIFLDVTDTAGQEAFVAIRDHYIQNGDGFVLVYSVTDERSFQGLDHIRDHIQRIKNTTNVPIIVCANKIDLTSDRKISKEAGEEFAQRLNIDGGEKSDKRYIETSAKTASNVEEAFQRIVELTYRHLKPAEDPTPCCNLF